MVKERYSKHFSIQLENTNCSRNHKEMLNCLDLEIACRKLRLLHHLSGQRFITAKTMCCRNTAPINHHFTLSLALKGEGKGWKYFWPQWYCRRSSEEVGKDHRQCSLHSQDPLVTMSKGVGNVPSVR